MLPAFQSEVVPIPLQGKTPVAFLLMHFKKIPLPRRPSFSHVFFFRPHGRRPFLRILLSAIIFASLALSLAEAAETTAVWDYKTADRLPDPWNGVEIAVDPEMKTPDGQAVLELKAGYGSEDLQWPSFLNFWLNTRRLDNANSVESTFWAKGDSGTEIQLRVVDEHSTKLSVARTFPMSGEWQKVEYRESVHSPLGGRWISFPRIMLWKTLAGQRFYLGPVTVRVKEER